MEMILLIAAGLLAASPAAGTIVYLPGNGPAPLRFASDTNSATAPIWKPLLLPAASTPDDSVPSPATNAAVANHIADTNDVVLKVSSAPATNANPPEIIFPGLAESDGTNSDIPPIPMIYPATAGDPSNPVSSQVWGEFFRPGPGRKNDNGVFMPIDVGFTPPVPKPPNESRAVYKVE